MWGMGLKLSRRHRQQLLDWAEEAGDYECCGLLLGMKDIVERVERTANVAGNPNSHFEIDSSALILAEKYARQGGPQILGYFHSHPNGSAQPSVTDAQMAAVDGRRWLIVAGGKITSWRPVGQPVTFVAEDLV
jgi:desampylase